MFPNVILQHIAELKVVKLSTKYHRSNDIVYNIGNKYILKVSENIDGLEKERDANDLLKDYPYFSKSVEFTIVENKAYYLKTMVKGTPLVLNKYLKKPLKLVDLLVDGIKLFHSIDLGKIGLGYNKGDVLVHGDFCLPNILAYNGKISGFIDLSGFTVGDPWIDYAWCVWSLEYNLNTKEYTPILLEKLGITFDLEKYKKYTEM